MAIYTCIACGGKYGPLIADPFGMAKGIKTHDGNYACCAECARSWNTKKSSSTESVSSKSSGVLGSIGNLISKELKQAESNSNKREIQTTNQIEDISKMEFDNDKNSISNQLSQLVSMASGSKNKELKNSICEKIEFGILKLRNLGSNTEADFFEKKRKEVKPKWWD